LHPTFAERRAYLRLDDAAHERLHSAVYARWRHIYVTLPVVGLISSIFLGYLSRSLFPAGLFPGGVLWLLTLGFTLALAYWLVVHVARECAVNHSEAACLRLFLKERALPKGGL
jgi:hypothetical protein